MAPRYLDEQRKTLHQRLGPSGLGALLDQSERGIASDEWKARPIVELDVAAARRRWRPTTGRDTDAPKAATTMRSRLRRSAPTSTTTL